MLIRGAMGLFQKLCMFAKKTLSAESVPLPPEVQSEIKPNEIKSDLEVKQLYLAFRLDPINDKHNDAAFCSRNSIATYQLERVILNNSDIADVIDRREIDDSQIQLLSNKILQQAYQYLLEGKVSPKSYEGLLNAANNFLKTIQLISGKPTERIKIEDLEKKTPEELHTYIMDRIRGTAIGERN